MGLFSVSCETCKARLTVRDRSLIGQIVECPKCGSMVGIFPPPDWQPPESPGAERPRSGSQASTSATSSPQPSPAGRAVKGPGANRGDSKGLAAASSAPTGKAPPPGKAGVKPSLPRSVSSPQNTNETPRVGQPSSSKVSPDKDTAGKSSPHKGSPAETSAVPKSPLQPKSGAPSKNQAACSSSDDSGSLGDTQPLDEFPPFSSLPATPAPKRWREPPPTETFAHGSSLAEVANAGLDLGAVSSLEEIASDAALADSSGADSLDAWASRRTTSAESSSGLPDASSDAEPSTDWYVAITARRWIWIAAATAAALLMVVGVGMMFSGKPSAPPQPQPIAAAPSFTDQTDSSTAPRTNDGSSPPENVLGEHTSLPLGMATGAVSGAIDPVHDSSLPADVRPLPTSPAMWQPKWMPPQTVTVLTVRPQKLFSQPLFVGGLAADFDRWRWLGPLLSAFDLQPHEVARVTWAVTPDQERHLERGDELDWSHRAVVAIELSAAVTNPKERFGASEPLGFQLGDAPCHILENDRWPYPYALVDGRTLVTGTSELLSALNEAGNNGTVPVARSLTSLLGQISSDDLIAWMSDAAPYRPILAREHESWLPNDPSRNAWSTLQSVEGFGCSLRSDSELSAKLYLLCPSKATAPQVADAAETLFAALAQFPEPPVWWPLANSEKSVNHTEIAAATPARNVTASIWPVAANVFQPQRGPLVVQSPPVLPPIASDANVFEIPLPDAGKAEPGKAELDQAAAAGSLSGLESWQALAPLLMSGHSEVRGTLIVTTFRVPQDSAEPASLALASLARFPRETADALVDVPINPPVPEPEPDPAPAGMPQDLVSEAPRVDIAARLQDPIAAIQFQQTPLADALDVLSQASTVPLAFDWPALAAIGVQPSKSVDFTVQDATWGDVLRDLLATQGAVFDQRDAYLWITAAPRPANRGRVQRYPIDDLLTSSTPDAATIVQWVKTLVAPQTWQPLGPGMIQTSSSGRTKIELEITNDPAVQKAVGVFLDKLRAARGKPLRAGTSLPSQALQTSFAAARANLNRTVTANFVEPAPLRQVARYLQAKSGVRILLDPSSLPETVWAQRLVKLSVTDETLAVALQKLTTELGVTWRMVDAATVELAGDTRLIAEAETEFYDLRRLVSKDEPLGVWTHRIRRAIDPQSWTENGGFADMTVDETSQTMIVRQTQRNQVAIELWLAEQSAQPMP